MPNVLVALLWSILDPYKNLIKKIQKTNSIQVLEVCHSNDIVSWPISLLVYFIFLNVVLTVSRQEKYALQRYQESEFVCVHDDVFGNICFKCVDNNKNTRQCHGCGIGTPFWPCLYDTEHTGPSHCA